MAEPSIWQERRVLPEDLRLDGRHALVTGAAGGIGRATALAFARFGADVAICDRAEEGLHATSTALEDLGGRSRATVLDVRDDDGVAAWVAAAAGAFDGRIDILVNNAGGGFHSPFLNVSPKGELALIRENFTSVTSCIRHAVPFMPPGSSIINITSSEAHRAAPGFAVYAAMKAAVTGLTKSLSMEFASRLIRVNCIAPDAIPTEGDAGLGADSGALSPGFQQTTWPETGSVEDCAAAAVYLASNLARFVTGTTLHLDGGNLAAAGWKIRTDGSFGL